MPEGWHGRGHCSIPGRLFLWPDCLVLQQRKVVGQSQAASATRQRGAQSRGQRLAVEGEEKPGASAPPGEETGKEGARRHCSEGLLVRKKTTQWKRRRVFLKGRKAKKGYFGKE